MRVAHCGRPNYADYPRMMVTRPFARADLRREATRTALRAGGG
jgi:hypothetical protein